MPRPDLSLGELSARDHAFYGLVWASTTLTSRVDQALTRAHDISLSWFEVMLWLNGQHEPVAASDLGAKTMLSRSQVSRVLDALHARGLVERSPSPDDARSVQVSLTATGRAAFTAADATRRAAIADVFDDLLNDDDIAALEGVWNKLKRAKS
ncbi:MAG TPA: MarR family winged helix-turn-helix transcriptional regulator [Actinocrinis sp.]|uniref:MarR family winged helix-turn-helix transcriptional regulator n=1 Tax=Actinocrinis sp. TaxID=1920516 RepID=UPI002DDD1F78|nr:MarR family winged helix-turn-helix transcriptional regulator [Actinocrinis sp.]HEV2342735.1 MarR family winged helix-turn-helix transcriptional regulator [Actinocrinis sp.]